MLALTERTTGTMVTVATGANTTACSAMLETEDVSMSATTSHVNGTEETAQRRSALHTVDIQMPGNVLLVVDTPSS